MITIDLPSADIRRIIDAEKYGEAVKPAVKSLEKHLGKILHRLYPEKDDFSFLVINETGIPILGGYYEVYPMLDNTIETLVRLDNEVSFDIRDSIVLKLNKNPFNSLFSNQGNA